MISPEYFGFVATAELPGGHCSRVWTDGLRVLKVPFQGEGMTTGRLAIDPKGLCGDPAYEAVAYVRNPTGLMQGVTDMDTFLHHRIERLSRGLNVPASRVWAWSLVDLQGESHRPGSDRYRILHTLMTMTDYVLE